MKRNTTKHFTESVLFILIFVFINPTLIAQVAKDSSVSATHKRLPILNNFRFIPSDIIYDPFITSFVKLNIGSGLAIDLKSYVKDLQGNIRDTLSGDVSYFSGDLHFQFVLNDWLALNASYGGFGRLGTNTYTILTSGISYASGFTLGAKARIWQNEKMFLSTTLDYKSQDVFVYSIYDFVKQAVENGGIDSTSSLLVEDNISYTFLNFNYAYAPADWCGILAVAGWGVGEAFQSKLRGNIRIGAAYSIDFENVESIDFPIGIVTSVRYNSYSESGSQASDVFTLGFKLAYTGHKDFDIGLENTYQKLSYKPSDEEIKTVLSSFHLRYFF